MRSRKTSAPRRTARRLLKVATLGIAGLVAGLLSGCSSDAAARFSTWRSGDSLTATRRLENLDYRRTPAIHHSPSLHRNQPAIPMRSSSPAYAMAGEIDAMGHHYESRSFGQ